MLLVSLLQVPYQQSRNHELENKGTTLSLMEKREERGQRPEAVSRDVRWQRGELFVRCGEASTPLTTYIQQPGCLNSTL